MLFCHRAHSILKAKSTESETYEYVESDPCSGISEWPRNPDTLFGIDSSSASATEFCNVCGVIRPCRCVWHCDIMARRRVPQVVPPSPPPSLYPSVSAPSSVPSFPSHARSHATSPPDGSPRATTYDIPSSQRGNQQGFDPFSDCLAVESCCAERGKPTVQVTPLERRASQSDSRLTTGRRLALIPTRKVRFNFLDTHIKEKELYQYFQEFGPIENFYMSQNVEEDVTDQVAEQRERGPDGIVTFCDSSAAESVLRISTHLVPPGKAGKSIVVAPLKGRQSDALAVKKSKGYVRLNTVVGSMSSDWESAGKKESRFRAAKQPSSEARSLDSSEIEPDLPPDETVNPYGGY